MFAAGLLAPVATIALAWVAFHVLIAATRVVMFVPGLGSRPRIALLLAVAAMTAGASASARVRAGAVAASKWLRDPGEEAVDGTRRGRWAPLLAFVGATAVSTVIIHSPVIERLGTHYHAAGDSDQQIGFIHAVSEAIGAGNLLPRHLDGIVAPIGFDLWASDGYLPLYAGGLLALLVSPLLAYNLLLLGATVFNSWVGTRLAHLYTRSPVVMALAGVSLATAPAVIVRYGGHLQLVWVGLAGLFFGAGVIDGRTAVRPARLGLLIAATAATSGYYVTLGGALYVAALLCGPRPVFSAPVLRRLLVACLLGLVCASPLILARAAHDRAERAAGGADVYSETFEANRLAYSADLAEVVTPPPGGRFGIAEDLSLRNRLEQQNGEKWIHPGWLAVLALGAAVVVPGRARVAVAAGAAVSLVLAWGPIPHLLGRDLVLPETADEGFLPTTLFGYLPVLDAMRIPGRFGFGLAVVGAAAIGLAGRELHLAPLRRWLAICLAAASLGLLGLNTRTFPVTARPSTELQALLSVAHSTGEDGDRLLVAPADCDGPEVAYLHLQIYHRLPSVGCTAPFLALPWFSEMDPYFDSAGLAGLRCRPDVLGWFRQPHFDAAHTLMSDELLELKRDLRVRYVLVDLSVARSPSCTDFAEHALPLLERDVIGDTVGWWLVDLGPLEQPA